MAIEKLTNLLMYEARVRADIKEGAQEAHRLIEKCLKDQSAGVWFKNHQNLDLFVSRSSLENLAMIAEMTFDPEQKRREILAAQLAGGMPQGGNPFGIPS